MEKERKIRLNEKFQSRKQINESLIKVHGFRWMYVVCFLQTRSSNIFNVSLGSKDLAEYLFKSKWLRLSNTQPNYSNTQLRFRSLKRKRKAELSVSKAQYHLFEL